MLCCAGVDPCGFTSVPPLLSGGGWERGALMHSVSWVANTLIIVSRWVLTLQCGIECMITAEKLPHPVIYTALMEGPC